ncbi:alpha/beta hydrolase fold [Sinosporangium album]|uniref:Alpha/beta hydrolase fold n=1 Tax=Sinosporangium album TaxID=504805 RepID=A0A1G7RV67_9ACTN|nr:alpha/beta hydrolase [Sinosporangium album]SDG13710.1 alpha/beta hydrolase fold [Sinosporangium album]
MKRVFGLVTGAAVLTVGVGVSGAPARAGALFEGRVGSATPADRSAGLSWGPCAAEPGAASAPAGGVECATLPVPLDHRNPDGRRISLALTRVKSATPAVSTSGRARPRGGHLGVLLVNPGGPGASGRDLARFVATALPEDLAARYDVIGFDPRGVGKSEPALSCADADRHYTPPALDNVPQSPAEEAVLVERAKSYARGCASRFSWMLPHMTTENVARDLDLMRRALGKQQISYLGYSYGSYLGAVYATLYPGSVKRLVLDSIVDPHRVWYAANLAQNHAFERRHRDFLAWVASHDGVYGLGRTEQVVRAAWYSMRDRLRVAPVDGVVGPSELDDIFTVAGYSDTVWPHFAEAFSAYMRKGEGRRLLQMHRRHGKKDAADENGYAVYLGVQCRDASWPRDWGTWRADMTASHQVSPFLTWPNAWYNAPCAFWPVSGGTPVTIRAAENLPPILLIQSRRDAATPYPGALRMRTLFPTARLLAVSGGSHGVALAGNRCVDRHVADYLRDGTLPATTAKRGTAEADVACAGLTPPRPAARMAGGGDQQRHLELIDVLQGRT